MTEIVVGVDRRDGAPHAVAFARLLADALDAPVVLASAFPSHGGPGDAQRRTERLLEATRERYGAAATTRALPDVSPARALYRLAARDGAGLLVVGRGRSHGSVAQRLLYGAPCAVAVVPGDRPRRAIARVGCGVDGRAESADALLAAAVIALAAGAELELVRAVAPQALPPDQAEANRAVSEILAALRARAASLRRSGLTAQASYVQDDAVRGLVERSQALDLLVVGSRSYGPADCVLLGEVSGRLVREASCPVLVTPRVGGADPLRGLGAAATAALGF